MADPIQAAGLHRLAIAVTLPTRPLDGPPRSDAVPDTETGRQELLAAALAVAGVTDLGAFDLAVAHHLGASQPLQVLLALAGWLQRASAHTDCDHGHRLEAL